MKKKYWETKEFKDLQKREYARLKESGFVDIETSNAMKNNIIDKQIFIIEPLKIVYFQKCEAYLNLNLLTDMTDVFIFEQHTEGRSRSEISLLLVDKVGLKKLKDVAISNRILRILKEAGIQPIEFNS